jgi:hypothetical protein
MAYSITKSDGSLLVSLPDQQLDTRSSSLTLIGKNVASYGTHLNNNFIRTLENFANITAPSNPLVGQLWFDTTDNKMYVYQVDGKFAPVSVSTERVPSTSVGRRGDIPGMFAFDTSYFYFCIDKYDGATNIWRRMALPTGTW